MIWIMCGDNCILRPPRAVARVLCYIIRVIVAAPDTTNRRGDRPHKPLPRKKIPTDLRSLARGHTGLCIKVLAGIVSQEAIPPAARVSAAGILLDRGWGRAPQPHAGGDGNDIRVTVRQIIDVVGKGEPVLIEHDDGCDEA